MSMYISGHLARATTHLTRAALRGENRVRRGVDEEIHVRALFLRLAP